MRYIDLKNRVFNILEIIIIIIIIYLMLTFVMYK